MHCPKCNAKKMSYNADRNDVVCTSCGYVLEPSECAPLAQRQRASNLVHDGKYAEAKKGYEALLSINFEVPGTCCHLARIDLLTDHDDDLADHTKQAWVHRAEAPPYVLPRILWFKLLPTLSSKNRELHMKTLLGQLKTTLKNERAFMEWRMQPALDHIKPKFSEPDHALLTALVDAFNTPENLFALDRFAIWEKTKSQPLE